MPNLKLPERWEKYTNIGKVIEGTKILTFKVPLNEMLCSKYSKDLWFTPRTLMEGLEADGTPLGLIIDLTFTTRYYNPMVFMEKGINYEKIFVPGKEVPSRKIIKKFCKVIDDFASDPKNAERVVGVHCTHGVNRTGFLVCRYMIDRLKIDPEVAIAAYATARGYPIERENYLADLRDTSREEDGETEDEDDDAEEEKTEERTKQLQHIPDMTTNHPSSSGWSDYETNRHEGRYRDRSMDYNRDRSWRESRNYNNSYSDDYNRRNNYHEHEQSSYKWNRDYQHSHGHRYDNSYHSGNNYRQQHHNNRDYHSRRSDGPYDVRQSSWHKRSSYGNRGGNWSLNNDSDYGQFGHSNRSDRSQNLSQDRKDDK